MKKVNTYLITCVAVAVAASNAYAEVIVSDAGSSINVSANDANINGYLGADDTGTLAFTQTGGSFEVTNTGTGNAVGIFSNAASAISVSSGTFSVTESGDGDATLFRPNDDGSTLTITGGTFTGIESGAGGLYGIRFIRDGEINISGGIWNFTQDDSSQGALFLGGNAANPTINLSGGQFNNLNQFDTHIDLSSNAGTVFNIAGLTLNDTGLTYIDDAIQDLTGTVAGTLADGNAFSFNFIQAAAGQIQTSVVPEPGTFALLAGLAGLAAVTLRRHRD